ncbi:MAG: alpha/beta hydrolase [Hyphomicrobiaceae bacterium]|nr:alpha/beta hydrolase [Hyphomicrobiaceae bacterium]
MGNLKTVNHRGARIAYSESGSGEPAVMIHCSTASGRAWESLAEHLGGAFRSIMPDQWGCGKSDPWTGDGLFDLGAEAAPILQLIERTRTPVHLVGHSYGGGVALRVAGERPDLVRSLTLIEPSCFYLLRRGGDRERALLEEIANVAWTVSTAVGCGDYQSGMQAFFDYWNGDGAWMDMPEATRVSFARRLAKVVLDFRGLLEEQARLSDHAALTMPTLLVCGGRSPAPSRRIVEMLASTLSGARVHRIAGAGHMSPLTHAHAVNAAIGFHLEEVGMSRHRSNALSA